MPLSAYFIPALLCSGLFTDLMWRKIPNCITLPAMLAGIWFHVSCPESGGAGAAFALTGICAGGGLLLLPFAMGGIGGGDVKLFAAMGAFSGPVDICFIFAYAAIAGGVISLLLIVLRQQWHRIKSLGPDLLLFALDPGRPVTSPGRESIAYSVPAAIGYGIYLYIGGF